MGLGRNLPWKNLLLISNLKITEDLPKSEQDMYRIRNL